MKRTILPSALILAFCCALAYGQTINKAVQLSQDPTGAIGVDTGNNVYFPGHVLNNGPGPVVGACGTGTPTVTGSDFVGTGVTGTSVSTCNFAFNKAFLASPSCVVTSRTLASPVSYTTSTGGMTVTVTSTPALTFDYFCSGAK